MAKVFGLSDELDSKIMMFGKWFFFGLHKTVFKNYEDERRRERKKSRSRNRTNFIRGIHSENHVLFAGNVC